ncbi:MAG: metal-dependent transcriptional regulator [Bradymonadaceae bacterium]|nr:metal-dependent transcriptional regulator [Lujinxingiaceae bacterium]
MPTISVENYLKAIYHLQADDPESRVKTKALAKQMEISLPSVTNMLKSLAGEGLVEYQPYKGARLTEQGNRAALKVIRNHRLIEVFLVQTLDYSWDEVHAEAERLEHAISDMLAERIDKFLAHPRFDPHGDPIPTADGEIYRHDAIPLSNAKPQMRVRIERVLDQQPEVLRYLEMIGLTPSVTIEILNVLSFDGQMFIKIDGTEATVSESLASRLLVTQL